MIEINLAKQKTELNVMGVDLSKLNWKAIVVAMGIYIFVPEYFLKPEFESQTVDLKTNIEALKKNIKKLAKEEQRLKELKEQIDSFKKKTKELEKRSKQVEKILSIKTNPNKLLEKVARSLPQDVWIKQVEIKNNRLTVIGYSVSYQSIGKLIESIKESPFFDDRLDEKRQKNIEKKLDGESVRLLEFEIEGPIVRYNPF